MMRAYGQIDPALGAEVDSENALGDVEDKYMNLLDHGDLTGAEAVQTSDLADALSTVQSNVDAVVSAVNDVHTNVDQLREARNG
jgi:hypothetical protein